MQDHLYDIQVGRLNKAICRHVCCLSWKAPVDRHTLPSMCGDVPAGVASPDRKCVAAKVLYQAALSLHLPVALANVYNIDVLPGVKRRWRGGG